MTRPPRSLPAVGPTNMTYCNGWTKTRCGSRITYAFNDTFRCSLFVVYPATDRAIEWLDAKYHFGFKNKTIGSAMGRIWWSDDKPGGVVAFRRQPAKELMPIMAHEASHWASSALDCVGWRLDAQNDEPLAYLTEWAVRQMVSGTLC